MKKTKEEYEELINSSKLFSIDKEKDSTRFGIEESKLIELIWKYCMAINKAKYSDFNLEIVEAAKSCVKSFKPEHGLFTHYFNVAFKKLFNKENGKRISNDKRLGIKIEKKDEKIILKLAKLAKIKGYNINDEKFLAKAQEVLGFDMAVIKKALSVNDSALPTPITITTSDNEEICVLDKHVSSANFEDEIFNMEDAFSYIDIIQSEFDKLQDRVKVKYCDILTAVLLDAGMAERVGFSVLLKHSFINENHINQYRSSGKVYLSRELAEHYNVAEQSISRDRKRFFEKLKVALKGDL